MNDRDYAYQKITARIVELLERGEVPWRRPWRAVETAPRNAWGRRYRGINVWLLLATQQANGYRSPYWLTFEQAKERGGMVRKGEHGTMVVFWKRLKVTETDKATGEPREKTIPYLRTYTVFNADQVDGLKMPAADALLVEHDSIAEADSVVAGMPNRPALAHGGNRAYYSPARDEVRMPERGQFGEIEAYYSTLFHELGHSTGHATRLAREGITKLDDFGSMNYGREELIAEMTAAFLCGETGIAPTVVENSAAYLRSWITTIETDVKAVVVAAGAAQRAADYILNRAEASAVAESQAA